MNCENNSRKVGSKQLNLYSVNHNAMLLHSNMIQYYFQCTPLLFFFLRITNRNLEQVEPFTQMPCPQVFTQRSHSRTLHTIFLSDGKLNATGFCSELSLPFTCIQFIFGILMAFNVGRSAVLFLFL